MGAIVHNLQSSSSSLTSTKFPLTLTNFSHTSVLSNGLTLVRTQEGQSGLFYSKLVIEPQEKNQIERWTKTTYRYSCNVLKVHAEKISMLCNSHVKYNILLEYGQQSLGELLAQKEETDVFLDKSQTTQSSRTFNSSVEILQFIKFLLNAVEEHLKTTGQWIVFHPSNIIFFKNNRTFKYLYLPDVDSNHERQVFFDPYSMEQGKFSESTTIFSIGMILMSILLKEDCSDCYDFQHFNFCWSSFEEKKEKMQEIINQKGFSDLSKSGISTSLDEDVLNFTLGMISSGYRLSFNEFKQQFYKILRKISNPFVSLTPEVTLRSSPKAESFLLGKMLKRKSTMTSNETSQDNNRQNINNQNVLKDFQNVLDKVEPVENRSKNHMQNLKGLTRVLLNKNVCRSKPSNTEQVFR